MDIFSRFYIRRPLTFWKHSIFHPPYGGFPLIALLLGMLYCLFFQDLKGHRFLDVCARSLLSDFYLSLLFNFKIRWPLSAHNFPNSGYFHEIFGTHFQKGLVYFYPKEFLPLLLYFWNYNPSPNGQIVSLIDAQTHL